MSILIKLIRSKAKNFNDNIYPTSVYYYLLDKVRQAQTANELGDALIHALAWKDGKIRMAIDGPHVIQASGLRYTVSRARPNTLSERHETILRSDEFFNWAGETRHIDYFDPGSINILCERFQLWSSIVIPVFILHCLRPQVFPIIDRWVLRAFCFINNDDLKGIKVTSASYTSYQGWWLELLAESGLSPLCAQINQLKEIDAGLWVLGKQLADLEGKESGDLSDLDEHQNGAESAPVTGTDSDVFKRRAVELSKTMTQREAIQQAAGELGIKLKPSYLKYPGSHFDRWRRQDFT